MQSHATQRRGSVPEGGSGGLERSDALFKGGRWKGKQVMVAVPATNSSYGDAPKPSLVTAKVR